MTLAAARPGPLRRRLATADAVHYPLTIRLPPSRAPTAITLHDVQHLDLPHLFSRAERAFRALAYHRSARSARIVIVPSAFVRDRAIELPRPRPGAGARDPPRHRPRALQARRGGDASRSCSTRRGRGRTRTTRGSSRPSRCSAASGPSCGSCSRAAATAAAAPDGRRGARERVAHDELVSLYRRAVGARLPLALRGLRPAAARGDGLRLPGRLLERRGARPRCAATRPVTSRPTIRPRSRRPSPRCSPTRDLVGAGPRARGRRSPGSARPQAHEAVYRELLGRAA